MKDTRTLYKFVGYFHNFNNEIMRKLKADKIFSIF